VGIKQLVIATWLATALLVAASTPQSGQQSSTNGTYDPWLDYNEDGTIDAADLSLLGQAYGAEGEPIKNVTVVGHLTKLVRAAVNVSLSPTTSWDSGLIWIDGYAKVSILISLKPSSSNQLYIYAYDDTGLSGPSWLIEYANSMGTYWIKTFDVMNQQIRINLSNISGDTCTLNVDVYLMA
jgi:hypothetical protein